MNEKINIDDKFKKNNFQVPENYFENFNEKLQNRISSSETKLKTGKTILLLNRKFAYAASIIVTLTLTYFLNIEKENSTQNNLNKTQIAELINEDLIDMDDEFLYDYIIENKTISTKSADENSVENYILDEVDESTIYDEI